MFKNFFILFILFGFQAPVWALTHSEQQNADFVSESIQSLIAHEFPELASKQIKIAPFYERDSFFQSNFEPMTLFGFSPVYVVNFNPRVFELKCPPQAIKAILAHELSHTLDYVGGGIPGIIGIGFQMVSGGTPIYEHRTDLRAVFRGYGEGLILYREWIYRELNPRDLLRKKKVYYSPEELMLLIRAYKLSLKAEGGPSIEFYWLREPPMTKAQILHDMQRFGLLNTK